jgi:hypothetical protein
MSDSEKWLQRTTYRNNLSAAPMMSTNTKFSTTAVISSKGTIDSQGRPVFIAGRSRVGEGTVVQEEK